MNYLMDKKKQSTKKKIKVRKSSGSHIVSSTRIDGDEDYYIPVAAYDSTWSGIYFKEPKIINVEHAQGPTDEETEIRVIDCDFENEEATPPLLLLFPDLRKEDSQVQMPIMKGQISTTSLTKMLIGKKPRLSLLKSCKKPIQQHRKLPSVEEDTESDYSFKVVSEQKKELKPGSMLTNNKAIGETTAEIVRNKSGPSLKSYFSEDADISSDAILNDLNCPTNKRKKDHVKNHEEYEESSNLSDVGLKESRKEASDDSQYRSRGVGTSNASVEKLEKELKPAEENN